MNETFSHHKTDKSAADHRAAAPLRWTFTVPTPLGDTRSSFVVDEDGLRVESDDPLAGGSEILRWDSIREGGTAAMRGMGGPGAPQMARWVPTELEWLVASRTPGSGRPLMRVLPTGPDRDALVAAVRARLGSSRWIGERVPLVDAQKRLGIETGGWGRLKVMGLVVAVLACLVALLFLIALLAHPVISIPVGFLLGGWWFRKGLVGLRDGRSAADTPTARASSAALGLVELEGRAVTDQPSPAGITGRPSVWWDVSVSLWYEDSETGGTWRQVAARHGGSNEVVTFEDDSGRLPLWLEGAQLVLEPQSWEAGRDTLPARGLALLDELGFPWEGGKRIRVSEQCVEAGGKLYVLGSLGERRHIPDPSEASALDRAQRLWRTGQWRRALVGAFPVPARLIVSVVIGYLGLVSSVGRGGERVYRAEAAEPPVMAPSALLIWKGRGSRPYLVSNRTEKVALAALRQRSLMVSGMGAALLCFTLYQLIELWVGK
jgi:hypothetical protein